jgi:hypothetical protein
MASNNTIIEFCTQILIVYVSDILKQKFTVQMGKFQMWNCNTTLTKIVTKFKPEKLTVNLDSASNNILFLTTVIKLVDSLLE